MFTYFNSVSPSKEAPPTSNKSVKPEASKTTEAEDTKHTEMTEDQGWDDDGWDNSDDWGDMNVSVLNYLHVISSFLCS